MSHRVTTATEMKDFEILSKAAAQHGITLTRTGDDVRFTSGRLNGAVLNLKSGTIVGDSDVHGRNGMHDISQTYGEMKVRSELARQGGFVESRSILQDGSIRLRVRTG